MTPLIEAFRALCFQREVDHVGYFLAAGVAVLVVLGLGVAFFKRHEVSVNDIV